MIPGTDHIGVTVVYLCHDDNGNYVFNKRSANCRDEHGRWDPGGGALNFTETVVGTLRREIKEEYRTTVLHHKYLGYRDVHREKDGKPTHWLALDFLVKVDRESVRNGEPEKFDDLQWFRLDALPSPMHSQWEEFYRLYNKSF